MNVDAYRVQLRDACLALACLLTALTPCEAATQTTTTTYQYNDDAAPVAVTTQVGARAATTTYLTWDDFTPNPAAPSTGAVSAGNGNLVGVGASPGSSGLSTALAYDVRNRLTGCSPAGQPAVSYAYHPASLMASSTLASGDALQFYYDNAPTPAMINTSQPSTGMAASFLGPVRYLSDGSEQVLLQPRKDGVGVYDAAAQSLSAYSYDPYGAPLSPSAAPSGLSSDGTTYDLTQNPFQYGGEYLDPSCNAYYLRARWYLPAQQTFLSRDAADRMHRFSYTAGNPVGRTDPSGMKFTGADFSRDVDKLVGKLTPGFWGYVEPLLPIWGQALGGMELAGLLPSFWHHPTTQGYITFGFLAASMVAEAGAETRTFDRAFTFSSRAFGSRIGIDVGLGASQTFAQSYRHGRLDVPALVQGLETTAAGIFWARIVGGVGYRPYSMTMNDLATHVERFYTANPNNNDLLVFRIREDLSNYNTPTGGVMGHFANRPILDWTNLGMYHESVAAVGNLLGIRNEVTLEVGVDVEDGEHPFYAHRVWNEPHEAGGAQVIAGETGRAQLVGRIPYAKRVAFATANPFAYSTLDDQESVISGPQMRPDETPYNRFSNNSHHHVAAVLRQFNF